MSLELRIYDAVTRELLPCWVTLRSGGGIVIGDWGVNPEIPGFPCDGTVSLTLPDGEYHVTLRRWLSHQWAEQTVRLPEMQRLEMELSPWVNPRSRGWYSVDSHNHLEAPVTLEEITKFGAALELDVVELCQSWAVSAETNPEITGHEIEASFRAASTGSTRLAFGIERPKKRFGHWWWVGAPPADRPFAEYDGWHDAEFCEWMARQPQPASRVQEDCPFTGELPLAYVRRLRQAGAAAVAPHPTSWWWESEPPTFVSNLALDAIYGLLAGEGPDGIVVMGYDADHIFYQNLWFRLLNEGYTITGCAETDASWRGKHYLGHLRQYLRLEGPPDDPRARAEAIREGRVLMTSGPFIEFTADGGKFGAGDHVSLKPPGHTLELRLWSAADPGEGIGCFVIYRNGRPYHVESFPEERPRYLERSLRIADDGERAWYLVKVYGANYPRQPEFLDVLSYAELCEREPHEEYKDFRKIALTNPIYFEPPGWRPPSPFECQVNLQVVERGSGRPLAGAMVEITEREEIRQLRANDDGSICARVSPMAIFGVEKAGYGPRRASLFLDYPPVQRCLEDGFTGQWLFASANCLSPGQAPWRAFGLDALRRALSRVDWMIDLEPEGASPADHTAGGTQG